jgi:excisionase family DNA binding protein
MPGCAIILGQRIKQGAWAAERGSVNTVQDNAEKLLTPAEVASMFRVDPKTVTRWAKAGKLSSIRTLGGHRRYRESEIRSLIDGSNSRS